MKFLCDRCKTRYSIGDDRVRGKILKIRCKNCANVITVREGMTDADAGAESAPRRSKTTTEAPIADAPVVPGALGAAFASTMTTKPPAALEEEWYVSLDGDQEGPYSLADAQRWVSNKAFDADLHCWSEGFDDWLPVDKVSHFRGLRKKPTPPPAKPMPIAPPPMPRAAPPAAQQRVGAQPIHPVDEVTPKPLFAATMASLERNAPAASSPGLQLPPLNGANGSHAKTNGAAALKLPTPAPTVSAKGTASEPVRAPTNVGIGSASTKNAFDVGDEKATQAESPPFDEPKPLSAKTADAPITPTMDNDDDDDDGLAIGEVSRVVKLADLMASAKPKRAEAIAPVARRSSPAITQAALNRTGGVAKLGNTGAVSRVDDPGLAASLGADPNVADAPNDMAMAPAVHATHRRGLYILIGVATLMLAGVVVAVIMMMGGDANITTLGRSDSIDTTRPDDPLRPRTPDDPKGSAANPFFPPVKPKQQVKPTNTGGNTTQTPVDPTLTGGNRLGGEDVEAMARSQSSTTQRCYMRAQRGADAITIGDVKKISVTIEVAPDGTIRTVGLDSNQNNTLGKCLSSAIKAWKFRPSPGGTYKFALVFSAG